MVSPTRASRLKLLKTGSPATYSKLTFSKVMRVIRAALKSSVLARTASESWIVGTVSMSDCTRSAAACAESKSTTRCETSMIGHVKRRAYCINATSVPADISPVSTRSPPRHRAIATPRNDALVTTGTNTADWNELRMECTSISVVKTANSASAAPSRARLFVVRTPAMPSERNAVMREFVRRTSRELLRSRDWNITASAASMGSKRIIHTATRQSSHSMHAALPLTMVVAQKVSRITHGAMPLTLPQSEVTRETNHPVGRRSK